MNTQILSRAIGSLLGQGAHGDLAFTRAFSRDDIQQILKDGVRSIGEWQVFAIGTATGEGWIRGDQSVELRENKGKPVFFLIDDRSAGAGIAGIDSAGREIDEKTLFKEAISILRQSAERSLMKFADDAIKRARHLGGRRNSTSLRQEFEFFGLISQKPNEAGRMLHLLGLWPVAGDTAAESAKLLGESALMVEKLLMPPATSQAPAMRISGLVLSEPSADQIASLENILRNSGSQPRAVVLETIANSRQLWLGNLRPAFLDSSLAEIKIISWRRPNGKLLAWSGLKSVATEDLPHLIIDLEAPETKLEIRWKTEPETLPRGSVTYEVRVLDRKSVV